jgi:PleD family two-component response regulator
MATTDPLTGLNNRRRFMELAEVEMARLRRYGRAVSVLMLDIDRFKAINDTHGHAVGDHGQGCLRMTVSIGVAMCGDEESSIERALGRADRALYEAKAAGRNRVVVSDGYPGPAFATASGPISIAS